MSKPRFIHLRVHSDYSIIDGLSKTSALVKKVASLGMPALAITDFTNLFGLIKFYRSAQEYGIKPIIGADFYLQNNLLGNELAQLTILVRNYKGYKNLTLLISKAYQRGYNSSGPRIDRDWLITYSEGLILLSGGRSGDVGKLILRGNHKQTLECLAFYKEYFSNNYYLELIRTGRPDEENYLQSAISLASQHNIPVVASNDVRFIDASDFDAHEIRVAIHDGATLSDTNRSKNYSPQQFMRNEQEMCDLFSDIPEALTNSIEIAKRCNLIIKLGEYFLPHFPTGEMSTEDFFAQKAHLGLEERLVFLFPDPITKKQKRTIYDERLNIEIKVINQMGFASYFLIVMEFIQWAKDNGIPVGPGRGSGAGSLVAYALKIIDIDPIAFDLLFERFLNPERISMPDFDIDFCMEKRDQVIEHVSNIYGSDSVAQIITFGTMAAKAVIRDVGRVLSYPYVFVDRIAKLIPLDIGMTLEKALIVEPQLVALYQSDEEVKALIDMARKLESVTRNAGKHAGGVVIAPTKVTDFSPIYCDTEGKNPVTQFDKNDVEYAGLVKFDFLGLRTLTIVNRALLMINAQRANKKLPEIDIRTIPLNDKKSFSLLQRAETKAVFQLDSKGMKELVKRLKPDCFEDIIAIVALNRPGPLQSGMVDNFIDRRHGREALSYPDAQWQHDLLKPVLKPTYGIILYQEQVMKIAQVFAGYSLESADILRRAMGKKDPLEMAKQRSIFENGAKLKGIDGKLAIKIFDLVEKFAGYGFNKSHSAAYAIITYQTLWLKTHYPAEFMAAVMTADMDNIDKLVGMVDECIRMGIKILYPDINSGSYHFNVNADGQIVYGLGAIKGVGEGPIQVILKARESGGSFKNLFDLCYRTATKKLNRRVLEKLILSGACDNLGDHRASLTYSIESALKAADQYLKSEAMGQKDMFGILTKVPQQFKYSYTNIAPWQEQVVLEGERETLGLYLTGHPITQYLKELEHYSRGMRLKDLNLTESGKTITIAGLVIAARVIFTKRGKRIGICTLDDRSGRLEVLLFNEILEKNQNLLEKDRILIVTGQVNIDDFNGGMKMNVREVMDINQARKKYSCRLVISLMNNKINDQFLNRFRQLLKPYCAGMVPIYIYYKCLNARATLCFGEEWRITPTECLLIDLRNLIGSKQVKLEFD